MYAKNAASPEPIAIGPVILIADGTVQTSGCTVRIKPIGVAEADGVGTTAYSTDGIVYYTPTQAETNYTSFILIAKKTACIPASVTVITTSSATPGTVLLAPVTHTSAVVPTVTTVNGLAANVITATSIAADAITDAKVASDVTIASVTGAVGSVTGNVGGNVVGSVGSVTGLTASNLDATVSSRMATYTQPAGFLAATFPTDVASPTNITAGTITTVTNLTNLPAITANWLTAAGLAADAVTEIQSGLATAANLAIVASYLDTEIAAILADTNELQTDWANGGRLDVILDTAGGGGGDATEANQLLILAKTNLITSQSATMTTSPVRTLAIVRGDSYSGATALTLAVTTDYTGYTPTFTIRHRVTDASLCSVTSVVVTSSTVLTITLTTTNTAFADLLTDDEFGPHPFDVRLVSGAVEKTESGIAIVSKDQTRA